MKRFVHVLSLLVLSLSLLCWVPAGLSSAEADDSYQVIDGYWPLERNGGGEMVFASGDLAAVYDDGRYGYGVANADGSLSDRNGTTTHGDYSWGSEVDGLYVRPEEPMYCVWDLGQAYTQVVGFPVMDGGWEDNNLFLIWGSNDFQLSNPGAATWTPGVLVEVYRKGWRNLGEAEYAICADDYVMVWSWPSVRGWNPGFRFVKAAPQSNPAYPGTFDAEIDAVKGVLPEDTECDGWETGIVDKGRTFSHTSLKVGSDDRVHVAYGGEQLYYAVRDGSTWRVDEVDNGNVGAYCSLALDSVGQAAISYHDAASGDLKYAYKNGTLNDVWGTSASDIYAVGDGGTILHSTGAVWSPMASLITQDLYGVWGSAYNNVFAVGAGGTILRYDGSGWISMTVPFGTPTLYGVWGLASNNVFAVGVAGTILHYDGTGWTPMTSGTGQTLRGVWGTSGTNNIFAVGEGGTIRRYGSPSWTAMNSDTTVELSAVWGSSASDVYAVGDGGIIRRYGGSGVNWSRVSSTVSDCLGDVWGTSSSDVFAVGCRGTVVHFNGSLWSRMISDTTNRLNGVWGSSASNVVAVGEDGAITGYDGTIWMEIAIGNGWLTQVVDSPNNVGEHTSLAFINGNPAISYYDATNANLKYATWSGVTWVTETVDSQDWVGEYTSLASDNFGRPAITYYDASNEDLKYAEWDGVCWQLSRIDTAGDVGRYSSLAFDRSGNPAVSYQDATAGSLKYARWNGSTWQIETVDDEGWVGLHTSLGFDASNRPGISYYDAVGQDLKFAYWTGMGWDVAVVDSEGIVGSHTSVDFDSFDRVIVSYYDATNGAVKVSCLDNGVPPDGVWKSETVDAYPWAGRFGSLGFDRDNHAAISFYDGREGDLKYAHWDTDHWVEDTVDSYGDVGRYTSLAFDGSGNACISYYDASQGNLKFARWSSSGWVVSTADNAAEDVGSYSSLAIDNAGNAGISYYDATRRCLKYTHWNGANWEASIMPDPVAADTGRYSSLAFDTAGNPAVSYYDVTNRQLRCARRSAGVWSVAVVDGVGDWVEGEQAGGYCSLKFDCLDNPAISYFEATNGDLRYAYWSGTRWEVQVVDSEGRVGMYTSLEFDASKLPAISYHDGTKGTLKLVRWNGEEWSQETVDALQAAGHLTSLEFDRCGSPAISYDSPITGDLKYASLTNQRPSQPVNKSPAHGTTYVNLTATLECKPFSDPCGDSHRASQWMITTENCEINCGPVFNSGVDVTNLVKIEVPAGALEPVTLYYWCVRHQDCRGAWSPYSEKTAFTTASPPERPVNVSPASGAASVSLTPALESSAFSDPESGDRHVASQWQITAISDNYSSALLDKRVERTDLTQFKVSEGVLANRTMYYWRVRYQDNHGTWSEFSVQTAFTTNSAPDTPVNEQPANGQGKAGLTPSLRSSAFVDADAGETHMASQWRVTKRVDEQSVGVFDSGEDTSNLTELEIPDGTLEHETTYYWQVRYQDSQGSWSSWSAETNFGTGAPPTVPAALLVAAAAVAVVAVVAMTAPLVVPL